MADSPDAAEPLTLPGLPAARATEQVVVEGVVQRVVYASPDGEFAVLRLEVTGEQQPIAAIGALAGSGEGETLRLVGTWETHPQYGRRLRVVQAVPRVPRTSLGVERYLASLAGLGPESAHRMVEKFGVDALDVLETEPWRVSQVKGLGKRRALRAAADAKARREEREVMVFLQGHGVSAAYAHRIRKAYGEAAMARVRENPYRLARDVPGIGFQIADRIAQAMGIDRLSPLRIEAGLEYTLEIASDAGHCYLPAAELCSRAVSELRVGPGPSEEPPPPQASSAREPPRPTDPRALLQDGLTSLGLQQAVILEGDDAFTPRLHRAEVTLARRLLELRRAERDAVPPIGADEAAGGPSLAPGQRRALALVAESPVCVITGGPGTGKTTIIRRLVRAWETAGRRVTLVAPTGRAAKRLSEATGRPAATVHRQLEWAPKEGFRRRGDRPLECDILVCDEASMLDLPLARALVAAVPLGATVVLVGDVDQLPSVGPGRVLGDIIDSAVVPVARLTEIFRQAEGSSIVENAHRIRTGQLPVSAPRVGRGAGGEGVVAGRAGDFFLIEADDPLVARDLVVRCCVERIPQRFGLDPLRDVQVLTPMHRGEVGTEELNRVLQEVLNPPPPAPLGMLPPDRQHHTGELRRGGRSYRVGDKVMQVRNDYDRDVWNGDVGLVHEVRAEDGELRVRFDEREVTYGVEDLEQLELAYAVSVHKSQGSEYPAVVVPLLMQHYVLLRRNLLYTAVTRGKQLVVLIGSRRALQRAVNEASAARRYTRLAERLRTG